MAFLEREFPSMLPRYERLYQFKYPPSAYREEVQGMVRVLQGSVTGWPAATKYERWQRIPGRVRTTPEQVGFAW